MPIEFVVESIFITSSEAVGSVWDTVAAKGLSDL